jgi:mRNA-degrading endonuclease RelE of RelBE toxin-antitoxin system
MTENFKVEFLKEVFEFLDKLDKRLVPKFFSISIRQRLRTTIPFLKS